MNRNPEAVEQHQRAVVHAHAWRTCLNCEWFHINSDKACRKFDTMPPPEVIVHGCAHHLFDIPF